MFNHCGFEYSEHIRAIYQKINQRVWDEYEKGEISSEDLRTIRFVRLFEAMGVKYDAVVFSAQYLVELGKGTFLTEGAAEICMEITSRGKQIFIVTNGILTTQESRIKHSLISDYISDFFVSESVGYQKPQIEYFEYVFSRIPPVEKDKILIIGDSLSADIAGGNNAGMDSCWFNERESKNHTGVKPTYEIGRLCELREFIN